MNIFATLDPAVKKLLGWKLGDEEEKWAFKAVESLVKKLRKKKTGVGTVEDLEFALSHPGVRSKCVTIPRSLDGRLQVSHRKGLPHVIYCRVWRWPSIQSHHEVRPISECRYPYDSRGDNICINPYHYQRVDQQPSSSSTLMQYQAPSMSQNYIPPFTSTPIRITNNHELHSNYETAEAMEVQYPSPYSSSTTIQSPINSSSIASPSALSDDDDFTSFQTNVDKIAEGPHSWHEPNYWCTICYYELNSRVGEPFKMACNNVVVDGFTDPSQEEGRICLGLLSNVNRNITIENTRRHIGKGVRFVCTNNCVTVFNFSQSPVFVQSRNSNFKYNLQSTAVCRVPSDSNMVVFDYQLFLGMLDKAKTEGYQHVYELQKMCFIRMSFVKGWGADYHRQDVTSTPCWTEIQLHQPLAWIDSVISRMDPPDQNNITSVS
ncbi:unnamed protein product [Bursaphelenchus okinawaensis]|uniref:Mothers against decapentaplegic homolog n=1 Tax=Bursaphelenchus okinawaensis TaxID=465554 RepID=A0A811KIT8_9BILA|nr:unnamed protein product [Bursaphelenchus okinawaensis]CAG9103782.1 unnamed protein product [Bursaphelenchus okinawaensis]